MCDLGIARDKQNYAAPEGDMSSEIQRLSQQLSGLI